MQWLTFVVAAASYAVLCVAFSMSVNYISVADATILTNSQSILLVAVKLGAGQSVLFVELLGVLVAFSGGILCARESAQGQHGPAMSAWWSVWGDVLGLISSMGGIGYIVLGKSLRAHMPVIVFMVLNMLTASFIILYAHTMYTQMHTNLISLLNLLCLIVSMQLVHVAHPRSLFVGSPH